MSSSGNDSLPAKKDFASTSEVDTMSFAPLLDASGSSTRLSVNNSLIIDLAAKRVTSDERTIKNGQSSSAFKNSTSSNLPAPHPHFSLPGRSVHGAAASTAPTKQRSHVGWQYVAKDEPSFFFNGSIPSSSYPKKKTSHIALQDASIDDFESALIGSSTASPLPVRLIQSSTASALQVLQSKSDRPSTLIRLNKPLPALPAEHTMLSHSGTANQQTTNVLPYTGRKPPSAFGNILEVPKARLMPSASMEELPQIFTAVAARRVLSSPSMVDIPATSKGSSKARGLSSQSMVDVSSTSKPLPPSDSKKPKSWIQKVSSIFGTRKVGKEGRKDGRDRKALGT